MREGAESMEMREVTLIWDSKTGGITLTNRQKRRCREYHGAIQERGKLPAEQLKFQITAARVGGRKQQMMRLEGWPDKGC